MSLRLLSRTSCQSQEGASRLATLRDVWRDPAIDALTTSIDDLGSAALMVNVASMFHETQYTRLLGS